MAIRILRQEVNIPIRNRLLGALDADDFAALEPHLEAVELRRHSILQESGRVPEHAYFIETGVVSRLATTRNDRPVEVALVGSSGFLGVSIVLGTRMTTHRVVVQISGMALRIGSEDLESLMTQSPSLRQQLLGYVQALLIQESQTALCNAKHDAPARLAKWLALAQDSIGSPLIPVTHEMLATILGLRRASITEALAALESEGILGKARGAINIVKKDALKMRACECYRIVSGRGPSRFSAREVQ